MRVTLISAAVRDGGGRAAVPHKASRFERELDDSHDDQPGETAGTWEPLGGPEFAGEIPDYCWADKHQVLFPLDGAGAFHPWYGLTIYRVWRAQRSDALIPDIVARQVYWGNQHPRGWVRTLEANFPEVKWSK